MVTFLGSLVQSCCGDGGTLQTNVTGVWGECSQCLGHTGFAPAHGMCAFPSHTAQAVVCSAGSCLRQALGCMHFPGLSHSGSGSWVLHKAQAQLGLRFVPMFCALPRSEQLRRPGAWQVHIPQMQCVLSPPWSELLGFLGAQLHLRCALCLFWGADLWLQPS